MMLFIACFDWKIGVFQQTAVKRQPHKIVKNTFTDELSECIWPFCGVCVPGVNHDGNQALTQVNPNKNVFQMLFNLFCQIYSMWEHDLETWFIWRSDTQ